MSSEKFWKPYKISRGHTEQGQKKSKGLPSKHTSLSPEKAGLILKHGEVRGHKLTPRQRGFLGAVRGKKP